MAFTNGGCEVVAGKTSTQVENDRLQAVPPTEPKEDLHPAGRPPPREDGWYLPTAAEDDTRWKTSTSVKTTPASRHSW